MKTETQIAEKNIRIYIPSRKTPLLIEWMLSHKASCERFLEFLEGVDVEVWESHSALVKTTIESRNFVSCLNLELDKKITDLKQAIKLYNEAGI